MEFNTAAGPRTPSGKLVPIEAAPGSGAWESPPRLGSALVVMEGERVLLGRRAKDPHRGRWVLPGGKVERFESIADAARRELLEETGLLVEVGPQIGAFELIAPPEHRVVIYSWGRVVGGEMRASSDLSEIAFVNRQDLQTIDLTPFVSEVLAAARMLPKNDVAAVI